MTGDLMPYSHHNDRAFTGLEAAIVLIAFVVVAAVFSYVVLGAGFYTSQKSQETVYKSVEQATSNIQMVGNVYGLSSAPTSGINKIQFSIGLTPGAPAADLTRMTVMFSNDIASPVTYEYGGATADASHFSAVQSGTTTAVPAMVQTQQVTITIPLQGTGMLKANERYNLEIRPIQGSSYTFSRTTGPMIQTTNIL